MVLDELQWDEGTGELRGSIIITIGGKSGKKWENKWIKRSRSKIPLLERV